MGDQQHRLVARGGEDVFDEVARRRSVEVRRVADRGPAPRRRRAAPGRGRSAVSGPRSTPPAVTRPAVGTSSPSSSAAVLLPAPLPPRASPSAGAEARGPGRRVRARRDRRAESETPSSRTAASAGLEACRGPPRGTAARASSSANNRAATARPSALAGHSAPRRREGRIQLGDEDQHRQAGRHGHQRHPERGRRLQRGRGQKADAQRRQLDHDHGSQHDQDLRRRRSCSPRSRWCGLHVADRSPTPLAIHVASTVRPAAPPSNGGERQVHQGRENPRELVPPAGPAARQ